MSPSWMTMQLLSYAPLEVLASIWGAPPKFPTLRNRFDTWVVVRIHAVDDAHARVTLDALGFGVGVDWDEDYNYFIEAWDVVLFRLITRFQKGPIDWDHREVPPAGWTAKSQPPGQPHRPHSVERASHPKHTYAGGARSPDDPPWTRASSRTMAFRPRMNPGPSGTCVGLSRGTMFPSSTRRL